MNGLPKPIIRGLPGPIRQPMRFAFSGREGYAGENIQRGTVGAMLNLSSILAANRIDHEFEETGDGMANIFIRSTQITQDPNAEVPIDSWDMPGQEIDMDIFEHEDVLAMDQAMPNAIGRIRFEIKRYNEWDEAKEEKPYSFPSSDFGSYANLATEIFRLAIKGTTHYRKPLHVLRHRQTVSDTYSRDIPNDVTGTERIYTTQQLLSECANFPYPLPARMRRKIQEIDNLRPNPIPAGYAWGWRKLPSSETTIAGGRIEVTTEYILELWSTTLYKMKA